MAPNQLSFFVAQTEIESTKTELARELATLKKCVLDTASPELMSLRTEKQQLAAKVERLEKEAAARAQGPAAPPAQPDERDQAVSDCFIKWFTCSVAFLSFYISFQSANLERSVKETLEK